MVYLVYEPYGKSPYQSPYRKVSKAEYTMLLLTGEWKERGVPCKSAGCTACGGTGENKTLHRIGDAV